jgi:hypothetical protein
MWYENRDEQDGLKKDQAIFAKSLHNIYVLLPHIVNDPKDNYVYKGYDWFNLATGEWDSCMFYSTMDKAIETRTVGGLYEIFNGTLHYKRS